LAQGLPYFIRSSFVSPIGWQIQKDKCYRIRKLQQLLYFKDFLRIGACMKSFNTEDAENKPENTGDRLGELLL
jgi:hypothetical protein